MAAADDVRGTTSGLRRPTPMWTLQILGGSTVLLSYVWSALRYPDLIDGMWGGVPETWRGLYTGWMFVAAAGYLVATARLIGPGATAPLTAARERALLLVYAAILLPSAAWMPLTGALLDGASPSLWPAIVAVLALVASGSIALLVIAAGAGSARRDLIASLGALALCVQTVLLDAVVWVARFDPPS